MENRSFNYLMNGYPGAYTVTSGKTHTGNTVTLQQIGLEHTGDIRHAHQDWVAAYDNSKMDGFDLERWGTSLPPLAPYAYVPQTEVQPYWALAQQYTLADNMFASQAGPSFAAHQYLIAGQSNWAIGIPSDPDVWGCDSDPHTTVTVLDSYGHEQPGPFPCFDYQTLADLVDAKQLSWRFYAMLTDAKWSAYDAISHIRYGPDWTLDISTPTTQFFTDLANGQLANVTWIVPDNKNSDHPGSGSKSGPSFVASVANAIGNSSFWGSTAFFVVWDEWGGWYDPVAPQQLDREGLGFRVPMLVVSPYARPGYVSHVQHEFGSILHFTEEVFGLGSLGTTDARADDLGDCFNFGQKPLRFKTISAPLKLPQLRQIEATDTTPPDD
jgi:phospholipase C